MDNRLINIGFGNAVKISRILAVVNPGSSPTTNLPLIMSIACTQMKMTPAEVWTASTINAAYAVGLEIMLGSITKGKYADIVVWNADNHRQVPYFYGEKLVNMVIKRGKVLWHK